MASEYDRGERLTAPAAGLVFDDSLLFTGGGFHQKKLRTAGIPKDCFGDPSPFGFAWNPDPTSPEPASTESDEDVEEEDYLAGLTRRMAHSFLLDDEDNDDDSWDAAKAPGAMAGSPQSTLCGLPASKKGSPNGTSLYSSPPLSPVEQPCLKQVMRQEEEWDLLSRAAGQVMQQRMNDHERRQNLSKLVKLQDPTKKPSAAVPVLVPPSKGSGTGYFPGPVASTHYQQLQAAHFYRLKQQQLMKQNLTAARGSEGKARGGVGTGEVRAIRPPPLSMPAWPPLQNAQAHKTAATGYGNGMRAVFLNGPSKESTGTGVFLPRTPGSMIEPRKKPARSTVLVPARVVQALNLNLEELGVQSRLPHGFVIDNNALVERTKTLLSQQRTNHLRPQPLPATADIELPQEWTY